MVGVNLFQSGWHCIGEHRWQRDPTSKPIRCHPDCLYGYIVSRRLKSEGFSSEGFK